MTELKFKYYYKYSGGITNDIFTIEEIEKARWEYGEILARCLYTGCKDMYGKEIYYGDKYIFFNSVNKTWSSELIVLPKCFLVDSISKYYIIIGNIYEEGV